MPSLSSKVVWITGASSGIGEALAYELARKGARLILSARRKEALENVKGNCPAYTQENIRILPFDLAHADTLKLATDAAIQFFGHIDMLINNGGIGQRSLAKDTQMDVYRAIMETNYFGTIALTMHLLPHFLQRRSGHFVTITSVTGIFGTPYRSGYAASKHALHGFFDSLRAELWKDVKDGIAVTLICPGFIRTQHSVNAFTADGTPLGHMDETHFKGKPPEWCARKIVRVIERKKIQAAIGGKEILGVPFKRWFPNLFARFIRTAKVR